MKKLWFVIEADEFNRHFLFLDPDVSIITNCELDHLDTYDDEADYYETFTTFMRKTY